MDFLHRRIAVKINLLLARNVELKYELKAMDEENILMVAKRALEFCQTTFTQILQSVDVPANPLPGDEPMVQVELEYFDVVDSPAVVSTTFAVMQTETIEPGKGAQAVDDAVSGVFKNFCQRMGKLSREEL